MLNPADYQEALRHCVKRPNETSLQCLGPMPL
jgi:hypothetical protein